MMTFLYTLIIKPLEMIFELIFDTICRSSLNMFLSIFLMSFIVSVLCLPLYLRADELQEEEQEKQKKLSKKVNAIKRLFKGDERQFLLQTYYKQNNYHPVMALRLSLSLLLQIPIFIAAYTFFNHLQLIIGLPMGFIKDLSEPDKLLRFGNISINVLPIIMTIVNIIAGLVYSKSKSFKENKVLIIMSTVFLVLLYNSSSALVLYWLFNNVFSLIKNICLKFFSHKDFIKYVSVFSLIVYFAYTEYYKMPNTIITIILAAILISQTDKFKSLKWDFDYKGLFLSGIFAFWVLVGVLIPSNLISASPLEFLFEDSGPIGIINHVAVIYAGLFLFWGMWIYYFANTNVKKFLSITVCLVFLYSLLNYLTIKMPLAILSNTFKLVSASLNEYSSIGIKNEFYWFIMLYFLGCFIWLIYKGYFKLICKFVLIAAITCSLLSARNYIFTANRYLQYKSEMAKNVETDTKLIKLSKTHKNVLIIFLDSAVNSYLPIIFEEYPKLYDQFKGFVYYPFTVSYARYTVLGYPPILGGYEYTPFRMDERDDNFEEKYNQAHALLPAIFAQNNWESTIINPVDSDWNLETGINLKQKYAEMLKDNKYYHKFSIKTKKVPKSIMDDIKKQIEIYDSSISKRNLVYYSAISVIPLSKRVYIYNKGDYHNLLSNFEERHDEVFLKSYCELLYLSNLTYLRHV